ncbi:GntR family transcriptional regulator/MocR family aminotransferase [Chryseobacterium sp. H1D6B]|uniref:MocR-like pyridoxine biosynthesis transcription factor PdxR n=1 Tax=Chryseobacterium sp. H1D6B TaxID=2940588 RepID=UPI0015CC8AF7|nr:PLP-dependent aminotransferase family protein [Chryseobacterium sp. H1D6B]MDH6250920.1 GntR family transcriptional regulator/MocR family aminotransferase [Chryseobacterium sp. H1D6B]
MLRPWKLELEIDKSSDKAVYLQIADVIIKYIQSGRLKPGEALPGSREMASRLNINRNTVVEAYQVLINEEWALSKERKGIFVADIPPVLTARSDKSELETSLKTDPKNPILINFDDGHPDSKISPADELARAYRQIFSRKAKWQMMGYRDGKGNIEFRQALSQMLSHEREIDITAEEVFITRGSQMAIYLTAQCLIEKGDIVAIENPGYKAAWDCFKHAGAELLPINVDQEGIKVKDIIIHLKKHKKIKAVYLTPHRQFPTTATLSQARKLELAALSNEYGVTIIEDDYNHEFHYGHQSMMPISSFKGLDNFVYIGTMSKVVAPALRIGYLATKNHSLLNKISELRKIVDIQGDIIMEKAILELINDGTIKKHIKKATSYYKDKRDYTYHLLEKYLKKKANYILPVGGLAFWIVPKKKIDWDKFINLLLERKISIIHPQNYSFSEIVNGIRLSYGSLSEENLEEGIKGISEVIDML